MYQTPRSGPDPSGGAAVSDPEALVVAAYGRHREELTRHLARVTGDPDVAADLVQESFVRLLLEARAGHAPDNVRAWLFRVAMNAAISRSRRHAVAVAMASRTPLPEAAEGPEAACLRGERLAAANRLLARVPPVQRRALVLAAHGIAGSRIAADLDRTHVATRTLMARARHRLRADALLELAG